MIGKIIGYIDRPAIYQKGNALMWNDEHISKILLNMHLDSENDIASRRKTSIDKIVSYIIESSDKKDGILLDLGCGPGLYCEQFFKKGFQVTGIDFSKNSIEFAKKSSKTKNLYIEYINDNYLEFNFEKKYDIVIMIYCDFGVLSEEERGILQKKIFNLLNPGGIFIFDALNENMLETFEAKRNWDLSNNGFWSSKPHLVLSESLHYPENRAILDRYLVLVDEEVRSYYFWNHYFSLEKMKKEFCELDFSSVESFKNTLFDIGSHNGKDISFFKVTK